MELKQFLEQNDIWYKFIDKPETIHTADAAKYSGIDLKRLTKSLVLLDQDKNAILAIISGDCKLSLSKVREGLHIKKVRLVPFGEAKEYSGYLPGATPMVHHYVKMRVIIDKRLLNYESIYGGGGLRDKLLELKTKDIVRLNNAVVEDICE